VVGQKFIINVGHIPDEIHDIPYGFDAVVESGYNRCSYADQKIGISLFEFGKIVKDKFVGGTHMLEVFPLVHDLDVIINAVEVSAGLLQNLPGHVPTSLDTGIYATFAGFPQKGQGKIFLDEGFTTAEGNPAAGAGVESLVLFNPSEGVIHRNFITINIQGVGGTDVGTYEALVAERRVPDHLSVIPDRKRLVGTYVPTVLASFFCKAFA
jgi:hypothetical protein